VKEKKQKIWQVLYYIMLIPLVFMVVLFVGAALPWIGSHEVKTVLSGSMEPAIGAGSTIVIIPQDDYSAGDIITFGKDRDVPTTHRIVDTKVTGGELFYITKGDANPTEDTTDTREEDIVGGVVFSIPYLGYVVEFAKTSLGFSILIGIPAILIIGGEIRKIYGETKRKNNINEK